MEINNEFKKYCSDISEIVIKKFNQKKFENDLQKSLNIDATKLNVILNKTKKSLRENKIEGPIEVSEDLLIRTFCKRSILFKISYEYYKKKIKLENITYEIIYKDWISALKDQPNYKGIEKYFNTSDPHFNNNAYFWYIGLKNKNLFTNIEIPFIILQEYLNFKFNSNLPITAIDKIDTLINEHKLTKEQQLYIYDKLLGLIANADLATQNMLTIINVEIHDRRWAIEPYDLTNETKRYDLELILKESKNYESIEDQITFLRKKQLEFENEHGEARYLQELINNIQIDIDSLYLKLKKHNLSSTNNDIRPDITNVKRKIKLEFIHWFTIISCVIGVMVFLFGNNIYGRFSGNENPEIKSNEQIWRKENFDTVLTTINLPYLENFPIIDNGLFIKYYFNDLIFGGINIDTVAMNARSKSGENLALRKSKGEIYMDINKEPYIEFEYKGTLYSIETVGRHYSFLCTIRKSINQTLQMKRYNQL
ncbi:MAG: hypothetical protein IT265_04505 [Saprospiraceae bacterium]|nr:hypothetical protein [Saprospiraceae bacterium]